ncbi:MAG: type 4a pilus biogenesis protein PilO [bacterium]|nr:type 4a pilus biogenesis protein PilO [bacterium]
MLKNLLPALIIGSAAFAVFVLILPAYDDIKTLNQEADRRQALLESRQNSLQKFLALDRQYKERKEDIDKISVLLPTISQTDQVVSSVEQIAAQSGMQLLEITTATSLVRGTSHNTLSIGLQLLGSYGSFLNFLKLAEQNLRIYDLTEAVIGQSESSQAGLLSFSIKINAYFLENTGTSNLSSGQ